MFFVRASSDEEVGYSSSFVATTTPPFPAELSDPLTAVWVSIHQSFFSLILIKLLIINWIFMARFKRTVDKLLQQSNTFKHQSGKNLKSKRQKAVGDIRIDIEGKNNICKNKSNHIKASL